MSSLLTDAEKVSLFADFQGVVDTFLRPLTIYQEGQRVAISSDPNFNPIDAWNQNSVGTIATTPIYSTVSGRILWSKDQEWSFVSPGGLHPSQLKMKDATQKTCRLKVDYSGYSLLQTAKKVEIDGILMDLESQPRQHGLFGTGHWTYTFVRSM